MIIDTKFDIGDIVYSTHVRWEQKQIQCPCCLGTKSWEAHLPNGEVISIICPACQFGWDSRGTIPDGGVAGTVSRLTVGRVEVEHDHRDGYEGTLREKYMCEETGVGSGLIHYGDMLFATPEEAEALLPALIAEMRQNLEERNAEKYGRRIKDGPGSMAAHYRAQIRDAKKSIVSAERGLSRENS